MVSRFLITTAALLVAVSLQVDATSKKAPPPPNSCDANPQMLSIQYPNDVIKMTGEGSGACGIYYRYQSHVACMKEGWSTQSNIKGGGCQRWIKVENTLHGTTTDAQILDVCRGDNPATFGCNDLFLSERAFLEVAGPSAKEAFNAGHMLDPLKWEFQVAPCWTCYAGIESKRPDGTIDDCRGKDSYGFERCGLKKRSERIKGPAVHEVCRKDYVCPK